MIDAQAGIAGSFPTLPIFLKEDVAKTGEAEKVWAQFWTQSMNSALKKGLTEMANPLISLVPGAGIEPAWMQDPLDFESSASTSFTTPAIGAYIGDLLEVVNRVRYSALK